MPPTIARRAGAPVSLVALSCALLLVGGCRASVRTGGDLTSPTEPLRVMSFNIRYDNPRDGVNA